nr:hypothetical protein [Tanacetum cinerariifolium]
MAFISSSSFSSDNEAASGSKACSKAYTTLQSHYDKFTNDLRKSQFDVLSYKTGLESIEARLVVYQQNENVFEEDIKLIKLDIMLRDNALNLSKLLARQITNKTGLGYDNQVFHSTVFDCDELISSKLDVCMPTSPVHDRPSVKPVEHPIPAENLQNDIPKSRGHRHSWNRKACFVCKSLTHLIKDYDYYEKKMVHKPGNLRHALNDKGVIDSGCSRHMTGNISYLSDFKEINGGYVAFGGNLKGGKLDFEVLLRVPDHKQRDLTCLFAKATLDESNLWHSRIVKSRVVSRRTMDITIDQQVALDEALFPHVFLVTADVPEIYMQEFFTTATVHHHSIRLVRNVDNPSKFYMYPRFLQLIINAHIADLSFHATKYTSPALTQKVFANIRRVGKGFSRVDTLLFDGMLVPQQAQDVKDAAEDEDAVNEVSAEPTPPSPTPATPPPPAQPEHIPSPSQAKTAQSSHPLQPQPSQTDEISMTLLNQLLETCATLAKQVANLEQDKVAQAIEITKLKQRVRRLEKKRQVKYSGLKRLRKGGTTQRVGVADTVMDDQENASKQGGKITELDADEDITLKKVDAEVTKDADVQGRLEESQAKVYHLDLEYADKVLKVVTTAVTTITIAPVLKTSSPRRRRGVIIQDPEEAVASSVIMQSKVKSKDKGKGILVKEPKPLKRQAQIEQDEAFAKELEAELNANINWNDVVDQVKRKEWQDNTVMRYQALKRKPLTEAQARKNMMVYLKNITGFKMDFFKG